jgi:hypothetical protein
VILADVAGHGTIVAGAAKMLRSQIRLIRQLNREFTQLNQEGRFAMGLVATYLSHRQRFTLIRQDAWLEEV